MPSLPPPASVIAELQGHPHAAAMRAAVREHALGAARAKNPRLVTQGRQSEGSGAVESPPLVGIQRSELDTSLGNLAEVLERGPSSSSEHALLAALLAASLADEAAPAPDQVVADLVWLDTHASGGALDWLDPALAERAAPLWESVADLASASNGARGAGRAEALVAAAALGSSRSSDARRLSAQASGKTTDPAIASLLGAPAELPAGERGLEGEISPRPYGPLATAILAATLILFVLRGLRLIGRFAFGYQTPATLELGARGLELSFRTELLGRVLRQGKTLVPLGNLARVTREVRYARTGMYIGLFALVLGTYLGMGLFVDGVRVPGGSPPLLGLAFTLMALGLLLDYALTSLSDSARGHCRILVVPLKGRKLCIGRLDPAAADRMLSAIAEQARREPH